MNDNSCVEIKLFVATFSLPVTYQLYLLARLFYYQHGTPTFQGNFSNFCLSHNILKIKVV